MAARTRAVVAVIFITSLVMLSSYAVQPLMDFERQDKIPRIRSAYHHKQRGREMEEGQQEPAAEPRRRQEQPPPSPTANKNFPGPDPPNNNK